MQIRQRKKTAHTAMIDKMQRERKTICEYCGAEKKGLIFMIGASRKPEWVMVEGTGKMCCPKPECQQKAKEERDKVLNRL